MGLSERQVASFADLSALFADGERLPVTVDVVSSGITVIAAMRRDDLLEVAPQQPRMIPVIIGRKPPWGPLEEGMCFWNYSQFGVLRGRESS